MGFSSQIRRRTRRLKPLVSRRSSAFLTEKALASDDLLNIALARIHRTGGWYQLCSPHWTQPSFRRPSCSFCCVSSSLAMPLLLSLSRTVRSRPEDTTDFVSTIFRGADWMLTSRYTVTISQGFGNVVNFVLTHPIVALDSLSYYLRAFAIFYVVLSFVWRVLHNFPFNCNLDLDV
ncbi:hypothetical protein YC2023_082827 [Brassica napus]